MSASGTTPELPRWRSQFGQYGVSIDGAHAGRGPTVSTNEGVIREVLDAHSASVAAAKAAVRKHFAADCVWQQSGIPTTTGPEEAVALLDSLVESIGLATLDVEY